MAKETGPKMKKYRQIYETKINVNAKPRLPGEEFEEFESQEMLNLVQQKYLEVVKQ